MTAQQFLAVEIKPALGARKGGYRASGGGWDRLGECDG